MEQAENTDNILGEGDSVIKVRVARVKGNNEFGCSKEPLVDTRRVYIMQQSKAAARGPSEPTWRSGCQGA